MQEFFTQTQKKKSQWLSSAFVGLIVCFTKGVQEAKTSKTAKQDSDRLQNNEHWAYSFFKVNMRAVSSRSNCF
jgi:hypothetical protein